MAHFNKRHYEAIATVMQDTHPTVRGWSGPESRSQWDDICVHLSDMFAEDNSLFNSSRFLHACLPGSNVKAKTAHRKAVAS